MLQNLLQFDQLPHYLDATDGLAAAVCHYFQRGVTNSKKGYSGWKAFIAENPEKTI
jgi:crossover junction endodeoxyribonuclease RuvC